MSGIHVNIQCNGSSILLIILHKYERILHSPYNFPTFFSSSSSFSSSINPMTLLLPILSYFFDVDGCHSKEEQEAVQNETKPTQKKQWVKDFTLVFVLKKHKVAPSSHVPHQQTASSQSIAPFIPLPDDSHLPIDMRKHTHACSQHPIANYMRYDFLSPKFKALSISLYSTPHFPIVVRKGIMLILNTQFLTIWAMTLSLLSLKLSLPLCPLFSASYCVPQDLSQPQ